MLYARIRDAVAELRRRNDQEPNAPWRMLQVFEHGRILGYDLVPSRCLEEQMNLWRQLGLEVRAVPPVLYDWTNPLR